MKGGRGEEGGRVGTWEGEEREGGGEREEEGWGSGKDRVELVTIICKSS